MNKKDEKACLDNRIGVLKQRVETLEEKLDKLIEIFMPNEEKRLQYTMHKLMKDRIIRRR